MDLNVHSSVEDGLVEEVSIEQVFDHSKDGCDIQSDSIKVSHFFLKQIVIHFSAERLCWI